MLTGCVSGGSYGSTLAFVFTPLCAPVRVWRGRGRVSCVGLSGFPNTAFSPDHLFGGEAKAPRVGAGSQAGEKGRWCEAVAGGVLCPHNPKRNSRCAHWLAGSAARWLGCLERRALQPFREEGKFIRLGLPHLPFVQRHPGALTPPHSWVASGPLRCQVPCPAGGVPSKSGRGGRGQDSGHAAGESRPEDASHGLCPKQSQAVFLISPERRRGVAIKGLSQGHTLVSGKLRI